MSYILNLSKLQTVDNLVNEVSENSNDCTYPSSKAVYSAIKTLTPPHAELVGKKTDSGGEIFNDYEDNQSISEFSSAKGRHTFVGTKFFYIIDKNEINKTYTLKDYYLDISSSGELAVNDLFSITTGGNREDCGTIESITQEEGTNNAIVTVSNWYWDNSEGLTEPTYDNPSKSFIFRVIDKPMCGTDIMGTGASSEGCSTKALMMGCHSEGYFTIAGGKYSHAEGRDTRSGYASHAEGWGTKAMGLNAHSEGHFTDAQGWYSHSEGNNTKSIGQSSHAEGANTEASGLQAHAEGSNTLASNFNTHAEGNNTQATKNDAHAEGRNTTASGVASHAEGEGTTASSYSSHAEGGNTTASGYSSHAEGENTTASGGASHAEGANTVASDYCSHAEGRNTKASGSKAHAEGENTTASGYSSHAEGGNTVADGGYSHAGGLGTIASGSSQTSIGKYNKKNSDALFIVGNGTGPEDENRSNAFEVGKNGTATLPSLIDSNGNPDPTAIGTSEYSVATKGYVDDIIQNIDIPTIVPSNKTLVFDTKANLENWFNSNPNLVYYKEGNISGTYEDNGSNHWELPLEKIILPAGNYILKGTNVNFVATNESGEIMKYPENGLYYFLLNNTGTVYVQNWIEGNLSGSSYSFDYTIQIDKGELGSGVGRVPYTREDGIEKGDLSVGDWLLVQEITSPDYWWTGSNIKPIHN